MATLHIRGVTVTARYTLYLLPPRTPDCDPEGEQGSGQRAFVREDEDGQGRPRHCQPIDHIRTRMLGFVTQRMLGACIPLIK